MRPTLVRHAQGVVRPTDDEETAVLMRRHQTFVTRLFPLLTLLLCFLGQSRQAAGQAVLIPGSTPVGTSSNAVNAPLKFTSNGTISSVKVFGQGTANIDFVNRGGNCTVGASFLSGQTCDVAIVFEPGSPGERHGAVVLLDSNNHVLASTLLAGEATGSVGVFVPGTINTVAGYANWIYDGDGRVATNSGIFLPFGIAVDAAGDLFIADSSNNRIRRVDGSTNIISTVAGTGVIGESGDGGLAVNATLSNPTSIALDGAGNLYLADSGNNLIRRIDAFTGIITIYAGTAGQHGYTGDNGPATSATFDTPNGISFDENGNLYIADTGNHAIRRVSYNGTITTVAGTGTAGFSGDGAAAIHAELNSPWSVTPVTTSSGIAFYVADQSNNRIRYVNPAGNISTIAGTGVQGFTGDGGPAANAQLNVPAGVLVDVAGNIYIADSGNNRVRRINPSTGDITTVAGTSAESITGDGGPADAAGLYGPYSFALDTKGNLYIADVFHNRIREVSANNAILNFPTMRVGRVSAPLTQTLENDGNAPLNLASLTAVTNSQVDAGTTTCNPGTPVAPLAQCVIGADFAPTTIGSLIVGTIDANSDAGNSPGVLTLTGQVLNVDPSTTVLTSNVNPSIVGNPVVFSVTANSGGATPTGTVNLLDGTTQIGSTTLQSGGVGTFTISTLTAGNHNITASYLGDSSNSSSVSQVLVQVVKDQQAPTTTAISTSASPSPAGASITLSANVAIVTANSGVGNIGGTVAFKSGANTLGVANINTATATPNLATASLNVTSLPVGTQTIIGVYSGSSSYAGSTSLPLTETIQLATSHIALSSNANPSFAGAPLTLTATLFSNGSVPTGPVNFSDNGPAGTVSLGSATINAQGVAVLNVPGSFWSVGTHQVTAIYAGDADNAGSSSTPVTETIHIATSTTAVTTSLTPAGLGASITFTAAVNTNGGTPTGTVQFFDGTSPLGLGSLTAGGNTGANATLTTAALTLGTHNITAVYSGDAFTSGSTSAILAETIQSATDSVSLQASASTIVLGSPLTLTANVTGTGSAPTGLVTLMDGTNVVATQTVPANGLILFANPTLAIGTHTLTAAYSGDTNHAPTSSLAVHVTVQQATTTAIVSSASTLVAGKPITITASVLGASSQPLTGSVNFKDGNSLLATVALTPGGTAVFNSTSLLPGQHTIVAGYSGDPLDAASASASLGVTVTIATTTTTFTTSSNPINSGSMLTLNSTVTGNGGVPTGSVTFHDGGTVLTTVQLTATGTATFSLSTLAPGIHELSASYSGDSLDATSVSPTISEQVAQVTSVNVTSSANPSLLQDDVTIGINVSNGAPSVPPTGAVTLTDGGVPLATLNLNGSGSASYTLHAPALGTHTLVVNYPGDNQNRPVTSVPLVQTVTLRPSSVSFNPSVTALSSGQQITLISVVQASGSRPATGTVTFAAGATILGSATVDTNGLATVTVTPPQGTFNTVAQYSGDSLYAASTSPAISIVVGPTIEFTINLSPNSLSMASGAHGTINISIASATTFNDTLALGCAGLPVDATCTFSTNQIPVSGGASPQLSVIVDTGDPLGAGASARNTHGSRLNGGLSNASLCGMPLAALFALLIGCNRRRLRSLHPKCVLFSLLLLLGAGSSMLTGCASSLNVNHTVAGNYTFQIIASGNKTLATQTATVKLTVTQ
jgi:sugar lactone lactonase YvrE